MLSEEKLEEYRNTVQKIIDKYIPEGERISVENYSQEGLYELVSMFLEKNGKKRKKMLEDIYERQKQDEEIFKRARYEFHKKILEINTKKEEYEIIFSTIDELEGLKQIVDVDVNLENELFEF